MLPPSGLWTQAFLSRLETSTEASDSLIRSMKLSGSLTSQRIFFAAYISAYISCCSRMSAAMSMSLRSGNWPFSIFASSSRVLLSLMMRLSVLCILEASASISSLRPALSTMYSSLP